MASNTGHYEPIAREGYPFVVPCFAGAFLFWWWAWPWVSALLLCGAAAIAAFFRNPERVSPEGDGIVVSPADGTVMEILPDATTPNLTHGELQRVSIFMSLFNVHVNRSPLSGTVRQVVHIPGQFLDAREKASSDLNERNSVVLDAAEGAIEVVQVAGLIARRIACWVTPGDSLDRGQRFGLIRFGSRLDVYLPRHFVVDVHVGEKVRAGVSVIARFR
ncbi:MAG: phosphatidylserine decarboxylase family protein [Thermodesulfobacteriota bacterium]